MKKLIVFLFSCSVILSSLSVIARNTSVINSVTPTVQAAYLEKEIQNVEKGPVAPEVLSLGFFVRVVFSLVFVAAVIYFFSFILKKVGTKDLFQQQVRNIKVLEKITLEPKKNLYLIRVSGSFFIIGSSENKLFLLSEIKGDKNIKEISSSYDEKESSKAFQDHLEHYNALSKRNLWSDTYKITNQVNGVLKEKIKGLKKTNGTGV